MLKLFRGLVLSILLASCTSINSVSLTSIPADRSKPVSVEVSKFQVLGFNFNNEYIDGAVAELSRKCPNGKVTGILTKDENINYFLYFFWKKQISAKGYCISNQSSSNSKPSRGTASSQINESNSDISESENK